jgi:hypothetical protein
MYHMDHGMAKEIASMSTTMGRHCSRPAQEDRRHSDAELADLRDGSG